MNVPTFTLSLREVDLRQYVDFNRVLYNPTPGGKLDILYQIANKVLEQAVSKDLIPMRFLSFVELIWFACQENKIVLNKRFIRQALGVYMKSHDEFTLVPKTKHHLEIERR
jgi:hypothetical protein